MSLFERWFGRPSAPSPKASVQQSGGGTVIVTPEQMEAALKGGVSASGEVVNSETAMRQAAVYACVNIISGPVATLPLDLKRRVDERTREDVTDNALASVLRRRPNRWQTPSKFRRMMQANVLLNGNAYALIVRNARGQVQELIPLAPDRTKPVQMDDLSIVYEHTRRKGGRVVFPQKDVLHLYSLTLDGVTGVTPITYARETIGSAMAMERHGANTFRNGAQVGGILKTDKQLGEEGRANIRAALDEYRSGGENAGRVMVLEDGLEYSRMAMTADDAQWIEGRKFSRGDIAMFFGVPPHMIGDTEKSTSWGSGIEQQSLGFIAYTLENYLTMWEEEINGSCIPSSTPELYARYNRAALVRGDLKTRQAYYTAMLQWSVFSPNEVRALEDMNPREGGDAYLSPPNTAGTPTPNKDGTP